MHWEKNCLAAFSGAGLLGILGASVRELINWANGRTAARAAAQEILLKEQAEARAEQNAKIHECQLLYSQMRTLLEETQAAKEDQRIEFERRFSEQDKKISSLRVQDESRVKVISRLTTRVKKLEDIIRNLGGTVPPDDHVPLVRGRRKMTA